MHKLKRETIKVTYAVPEPWWTVHWRRCGKKKTKKPLVVTRCSAEIKNWICPVSSNFPQLMYVYISTVIIVNISQKGLCFLFTTLSWGFPHETDCETLSLWNPVQPNIQWQVHTRSSLIIIVCCMALCMLMLMKAKCKNISITQLKVLN